MRNDRAATLAVDGLAAWRLTHLIVADTFPPVAAARDAVLDRFGPDHWVSELITCTYCAGVWVAAGTAVARRLGGRRWDGLARMLAVAAAAPIVERIVNP